jgi:hypothetical protein
VTAPTPIKVHLGRTISGFGAIAAALAFVVALAWMVDRGPDGFLHRFVVLLIGFPLIALTGTVAAIVYAVRGRKAVSAGLALGMLLCLGLADLLINR